MGSDAPPPRGVWVWAWAGAGVLLALDAGLSSALAGVRAGVPASVALRVAGYAAAAGAQWLAASSRGKQQNQKENQKQKEEEGVDGWSLAGVLAVMVASEVALGVSASGLLARVPEAWWARFPGAAAGALAGRGWPLVTAPTPLAPLAPGREAAMTFALLAVLHAEAVAVHRAMARWGEARGGGRSVVELPGVHEHALTRRSAASGVATGGKKGKKGEGCTLCARKVARSEAGYYECVRCAFYVCADCLAARERMETPPLPADPARGGEGPGAGGGDASGADADDGVPPAAAVAYEVTPLRYVGYVVSVARSSWMAVVGALAGAVVSQGCRSRLPGLRGGLVDAAMDGEGGDFWRVAGWMAACTAVPAALEPLVAVLVGVVAEHTRAVATEGLLTSLLRQELDFYDAHGSGDLVNRVAKDVEQTVRPCHALAVNALTVTLNAGLALAACCRTSWRLTALMLSLSLPTSYALSFYLQGASAAQNEISTHMGEAQDAALEGILQVRTVKTMGGEAALLSRFRTAMARAKRAGVRDTMRGGVSGSVSENFSNATYVLIGWYGALMIMDARGSPGASFAGKAGIADAAFTAGSLVSFQLSWRQFMAAVDRGGKVALNFVRAMGAARRVLQLTHRVPVIDADVGRVRVAAGAAAGTSAAASSVTTTDLLGRALPDRVLGRLDHLGRPVEVRHSIEGALRFEVVSFRYRQRWAAKVLDGFSLDIPAGTICALVGASGSGKSTAIHLLLRLYDPTSGSVLLDGTDLRDYRLRDLQPLLGFVGQETHLFSGTVADNIVYGYAGAGTDEAGLRRRIEEAARAAYAHDFIVGFPDGYDTVIGERGMRLSGGQRQRLAIARALIRQPRILLLDEATSALDAESEVQVQRALDGLLKRAASDDRPRTVVVVAHRLSTVRDADIIAVVDRGRVVEQGNHASLLARNGAYARLVATQLLPVPGGRPNPAT